MGRNSDILAFSFPARQESDRRSDFGLFDAGWVPSARSHFQDKTPKPGPRSRFGIDSAIWLFILFASFYTLKPRKNL
jgi:hypothetical protein